MPAGSRRSTGARRWRRSTWPHDAGIPVHVYVDETRPRNQGAALTAYELGGHGVPHTVIVDNAGGHLMQRGQVDMVIVGTDRTTADGDVANKIGTYLKALAAHDNGVPFYVALPSPTIDWSLSDGMAIPIEERSGREVTHLAGQAMMARSAPSRRRPGQPGRQPGLRRDAGALCDGPHHRARCRSGHDRGACRPVSRICARSGSMSESQLRAEIVAVAQAIDRAGFCPSKSGNVSARFSQGMLITPSGLPYAQTTPDDLIHLSLDGTVLSGARKPSSEWPFHVAIYQARPDAQAIVHTHSPRATALSSTRRGIPAFHYMIALCGGADVRCAPYATFGTPELAENAVRALEGRKAVLLANHGVIALGGSLAGAHQIVAEVENLAGQYLDILAAGLEPVILDEAEMARVSAKFAGYGKVG
jgi:L-fuculose-phosphate aldolase